MFFNLFGGNKASSCKVNDATYLSETAKNNALIKYTIEHPNVICITWFPDSATLFKKLFAEKGLDESRVVEAKFYNVLKQPGKELFFAEHYPLPAKEDEFLARLPQKNILVYNSITDPLFKIFGGEKIIELMKKMGVKEDEVISHDMISRSIRRAQEKLASSIPAERHAASQEQWFRRNYFENKISPAD